jgi:hypothetical protein
MHHSWDCHRLLDRGLRRSLTLCVHALLYIVLASTSGIVTTCLRRHTTKVTLVAHSVRVEPKVVLCAALPSDEAEPDPGTNSATARAFLSHLSEKDAFAYWHS